VIDFFEFFLLGRHLQKS